MCDSVYVNGTLIWYYYICKREVWLMSRNIIPDQDKENIELGRFIHESSYQRKEKEIQFGSVKFDIVDEIDGKLVISEVKKSSKYSQSAKMQLAYYLMQLEHAAITAEGKIRYPKEKRTETIKLTPEIRNELYEVTEEIKEIALMKIPPKPEKVYYCKSCAYQELCWA